MSRLNFAPRRSLPAPLSGILGARRPTGVILGTIVSVVAVYGGLMLSALAFAALTGSHDMPSWMMIVAFGLVIVIIWAWLRLKERRGLRTLGFTHLQSAPRQALRGVGVGLLLLTLVMLTLVLTGQATIRWNGGALGSEGWLLVLFGILTFAVQGSAEEIASRGFAMQAYARRFGVIGAILAQAILFAALHANNDGMGVLPVVNLLLVAILLGCWSITDGALWGVCAFHATWNWAQSKLFGAAVSGQGGGSGGIFIVSPDADGVPMLTGGVFGAEGSMLVTVVLGAAILVLIPTLRRRLAAAKTTVAAAPALEASSA